MTWFDATKPTTDASNLSQIALSTPNRDEIDPAGTRPPHVLSNGRSTERALRDASKRDDRQMLPPAAIFDDQLDHRTGSASNERVPTGAWCGSPPVNQPSRCYDLSYAWGAGSPNGPWQRLTRSPVAWWETHYTAQGLATPACDSNFPTPECHSYRVIAVDINGSESPAVAASNNPSSGTCPATPEAPKNLRASNTGTAPNYQTLLEWDPSTSPGVTQYTVYRMVVWSKSPYFYPTQRVMAPTTTYTEAGDDPFLGGSCPDHTCSYADAVTGGCLIGYLDAYYVTARFATGGESPRSNLIFWKADNPAGGGGYVRTNPTEPFLPGVEIPGELLACWDRGDTEWGEETMEPERELLQKAKGHDEHGSQSPQPLVTASMIQLGLIDPPWKLYNLHTDHLGTVCAVTDTMTGVASRNDYFPFGEEITPQFSYNTHQYTGHERDRESGLDYMLARYYGESLPRFLSPDPIGGSAVRPQSWNRYAYVRGNPMRLVDPSGMSSAIPDMGPGLGGGNPFGPGGAGGWWPSGPGGAVGWGNIPCVMCDGAGTSGPGTNPPLPPGYDPDTWESGQWDGGGPDFVRDPSGDVWTAQPEDRGHWRHWDKQDVNGKFKGRWPKNSLKPWPGQKQPPFGDQSATDPSGDAPGYKLQSIQNSPLLNVFPFPPLVGLGLGVPGFSPVPMPIPILLPF